MGSGTDDVGAPHGTASSPPVDTVPAGAARTARLYSGAVAACDDSLAWAGRTADHGSLAEDGTPWPEAEKPPSPKHAPGGPPGSPGGSQASNQWSDAGQQVVLSVEYMSNFTTRVLLYQFRLALALALGLLGWETYTKFAQPNRELVESSQLVTLNAVVASTGLAATLSLGALLAWRIWRVNRAGKVWGPRRKRAVLLIGTELAIQTCNLVFYLAPNALVLSQPCSWFLTPIYVFSAVRWCCWNALFCLFVVQAHNPLPAQYTGRVLLRSAVTGVVQPARAAGRYVQRMASRDWQAMKRHLPAAGGVGRHQAAADAAAEAEADEQKKVVERESPPSPGSAAGQVQGPDDTLSAAAASLVAAEAGGGVAGPAAGRAEGMIADLPFASHIYKALFLWLPTQLAIIFFLAYELGAFGGTKGPCSSLTDLRCYPEAVNGTQDCRSWRYPCSVSTASLAITSLTSALLIFTLLVYFLLIYFAQRQLARRPYQTYRTNNIMLRLQYQTRLVAAAFFLLCNTLFWYIGSHSCTSYMETWLGLTPMEVVMTSLVALNIICILPCDPGRQQRELRTWLQGEARAAPPEQAALHYAWLEADLPRKVALRPMSAAEPMFCVQTALKMLCWSWVVYLDDEEQEAGQEAAGEAVQANGEQRGRDVPRQAAAGEAAAGAGATAQCDGSGVGGPASSAAGGPEDGGNPCGSSSSREDEQAAVGGGGEELSLGVALGLYGLTRHRVLWGPQHDAKCLVGWGDGGTIVCCFRGTVSLKNMVWRAAHPPVRGSYWLGRRPMVHWGFLACWQANGLNTQVMDALREVLTTAPPPPAGRPWRLLFTGHSLGGALASLAAHDAVALCRQLGIRVTSGQRQRHGRGGASSGAAASAAAPGGSAAGGGAALVTVYTFGAPRPGNHAFARDYQVAVPASFDVVHCDDAVTRHGKFLVLFKRAAHLVVLTREGDLIVRPSLIERSARESFSTSLQQHLLSEYGRSFAALIRGQFTAEREHNRGRRGCKALLRCRYVRQVLRTTAGVRHESLARLAPLHELQARGRGDQHLASGVPLAERRPPAAPTFSLTSSWSLARTLTWSPQASTVASRRLPPSAGPSGRQDCSLRELPGKAGRGQDAV